jgi:hypothetical protein
MTLDEVKARQKTQNEIKDLVKKSSDTALAKVEASGLKLAAELEKRAKRAPSITAAEKTKNIAANRKQAQSEERLQKDGEIVFETDTSDTGVDEEELSQNFTSSTIKDLIRRQRKDAKP